LDSRKIGSPSLSELGSEEDTAAPNRNQTAEAFRSVSSVERTGKFIYCGQRKSKTKIQPTPWNRILEEPTGPQLVKKFPALCGTRIFITAFTFAATFPCPELVFPIPILMGQF
jgi:hypothetical protein